MVVLVNVIKPQGLEPLQFPTKFRSPSIVERHPNDWATANALGEALEAVGETARPLAVLLEL